MSNKQEKCRQLQKYVCIQNFWWSCEKYQFSRNRMQIFNHGLLTWMVMQRNVRKVIELFAHKLFWNVCIWLVLGDLIFLWSVNKFARAVKKWTKSCDERLMRLISYIHHTSEHRQCWYVRNTAQQCRLGLNQGSYFAGDFEDSKWTSGGLFCIFGSHTFVPTNWMCKKQISVSHSSTEDEIISLGAGLRMDGISALTLWELVIEVFHSVPNRTDGPKRAMEKPVGSFQANMHNSAHQGHSNKHWSHSINYNALWFQCYVICLWGHWSRDFDDNQGQESNNVTRVKNLQVCSGLVVLTASTWIRKF